jgi:hypothetical protein
VLAPFPLGSADFVWICIWNVLLAFSLLTANLEAISRQDFRLLMLLFLTIFLIIAIVMLQAWPNLPIGQTDSVWKLPHELLGIGVPARISMTATGPWRALGYPLLLSLAFVRAVLLATDAGIAQRLLRIFAWTGCLCASLRARTEPRYRRIRQHACSAPIREILHELPR